CSSDLFQYYAQNNHSLFFGFNVLNQKVSPADFVSRDTTTLSSIASEPRRGIELNAYVSHDWKITDRRNALYGVRHSSFLALGPGTIKNYEKGGDVAESTYDADASISKQYLALEPSISVVVKLNEPSSLEASYRRNSQNLH